MLGQSYKDALVLAVGAETSVWHYVSDFSTLWSNEFGDCRPILIVWDSAPLGGSDNRDDRLLEPHLTPLDWALSWSIKRAREGADIPSIVIVDARVDNRGNGWAWTVRHQLIADMPWVTLTAPVVRTDGSRELYEWMMSLQTLDGKTNDNGVIRHIDGKWKIVTAWNSRKVEPFERTALSALNNLWVASLSQSDEHHDINNIVTPLLLLRDPGELDGDGAGAIYQRLHWTGLQLKPSEDGHNEYSFPIAEKREDENTTRLVVIDDQARRWAPLLANLLDVEYRGFPLRSGKTDETTAHIQRISEANAPFELWAADNLNAINKHLTKLEIVEKSVFDRIQFTDGDVSGATNEILLLDLDLNTPNLVDYIYIISVARSLDKSGRSRHLWGQPLISEELDTEQWLNVGKGSKKWRELMVLPAKVLATVDPTLPIILFSSTNKRSTIESLRPFYNIVTGFEKPQLLSGGRRDALVAAKTQLNAVLNNAKKILEVRKTISSLGDASELNMNLTENLKNLLINSNINRTLWVDIYIDETGSHHSLRNGDNRDNLTIGALTIIGERENIDDYEYCRNIDFLVDNSIREYKEILDQGGDLKPSKYCEECRGRGGGHDLRYHVKDIFRQKIDKEDFDIMNAGLFYSTISCKNDTSRELNKYFNYDKNSAISDFTYRIALSALLETVIFHQIRRILKGANFNIRLHLANLSLNLADYGKERAEFEQSVWGTDILGNRIRFLSDRDAKEIIFAILKKFQVDDLKISRARSYNLDISMDSATKSAHYLADALVGGGIKGFTPQSRGSLTKELGTLLRAGEYSANGEIGRAIATAQQANDALMGKFGDRHIINWLRAAISSYISKATGADFAEAVRVIAVANHD